MRSRPAWLIAFSMTVASPALAQPTAGKVRLGETVSGPSISKSDFAGKAVVLKMWGRH